jgi:hypothetical protein
MDRWEYRIVRLSEIDPDARQGYLNELGNEGWELVSVTARTRTWYIVGLALHGKQHADCEGSLGWDSVLELAQEKDDYALVYTPKGCTNTIAYFKRRIAA